ncbi:ABC transporter permease [Actinoplanes sp. NBRC 14428]|uniref:Amino acid/amide ABC transporter substrate-binding protein (HAAT family) n=1 Tax=Pseudosporangium ferrugineum TaxID=439699 RepID=A0A2T0SB95_9ACTN|nr:ABC transporter substrate-binding protein [Pseudosporangium ferrugineum]PRY30694.1 amino acid/amide ABC transporter substrate-binding protein (HAAT family) [Pseudosporangium ferrugineum]BCJ50240.1 ABC transporter permease [Actinoplanes sp. NBRC 14428]
MTSKRMWAGASAMSAVLLLGACGGGGPGGSGGDFSGGKLVLAVLNDQSGVYKDASGPNSVKAVKMAVADFQKKYGDKAVVDKIEVTSTDHQNKPDIANTKASELYERRGADVILDVPTSSAALAVANQAKKNKKLFLDVSAATTALTGAQCNKYTFQWAYNTYMLANGTGTTVTEKGGKKWNIIYPDYEFGQNMSKSFSDAVTKAGGTVQGTIPTPFPNENFATFLTKAGSTDPDVIGTMQAGGDLINLVKQFNESGLKEKGIELAVGLMLITDIHSLGVDQFADTMFTDAWYWNMDPEARAWADRFLAETGTRPTFEHAGNYSAALQYLEAVQEAGTDDADAVVAKLEGKKINDVFLRNGEVRAKDHSVVHDAYLVRVKKPSEVKEDWDYEEIVATIPAAKAFAPAEASGCTLS